MFKRKKQVNYLASGISLVVGTLIGLAYALLSTKQTGKEFQKEIKKRADKAIKCSKKKIGEEFDKAKREIGNEFEAQMTKSVASFKDKSKELFGKMKTLVK